MREESWWDRLRVRQKDVVIVLLLCAPLIFAIPFHVILINKLRVVQQHHRDLLLAHDQIHTVRRLAIDIEDAFLFYNKTKTRSNRVSRMRDSHDDANGWWDDG